MDDLSGERFLAKMGFADSRNYSAAELGPLLEAYAVDCEIRLLRRLNAGEPPQDYSHFPHCADCKMPVCEHIFPILLDAYKAGEPGKPRCPKCSASMKPLFKRVSVESKSAVKVECQGASTDELSFHGFILYSVADFAQFFPGERREEWAQKAFELLSALHQSVEWELAPAIKGYIAELVKSYALPAPDSEGK